MGNMNGFPFFLRAAGVLVITGQSEIPWKSDADPGTLRRRVRRRANPSSGDLGGGRKRGTALQSQISRTPKQNDNARS